MRLRLAVCALLCCAAAPAVPTNVLLLSVDTLRADHLGCYSYDRPTSPTLDALAAQSLLFEDAVCEIPLTNPSMGSMLSSRYPRMNGTTRNGLPMPAEVPLVQEVFQQNGYHTLCVTSNWTLKRKLSGLDRGFDVYDDNFHKKRWGFIKPERPGEEVTELAIQALTSRPQDKPFFAWVHYSDPHAPYKLHADHQPAGKGGLRRSKAEKVKARYDSEIAFTDAQIARLLQALPENTAILFVGDHGESLYDHGYLGHGRRIHQPGLHIPLFVRAESVSAARSAFPARGLDVGPTLLGLAGLPRPEGMLGLDLLHDTTLPTHRARVVETYGGAVPNVPGARAVMGDAGPMLQGVIADRWKLVVEGRQTELYHLEVDKEELNDLSASEPERVKALREILDAWNNSITRGEASAQTLTQEDIQALESLGYVE